MTPAEFRVWRKRLGLTQAHAAAALGRSKAWVEKAEAGDRPILRTVQLAMKAVESAYLENERNRIKPDVTVEIDIDSILRKMENDK